MPTTTDIIWMKDIKSNNHSSILIFCNSSISLFFKKVICFFCCKFFFLWKCYSISYDLIPNFCCILGILCFIFSYEKLVKDCIVIGKEKGYRILQFNAVVTSNIHALHLYHRLGFIKLGVIPQGFKLPDGTYEDIIPHYITL